MMTTRELASVIWLTLLLLSALPRREFRTSLCVALKTLLQVKILALLVGYVVYIAVWVWLAAQIGLWDRSLLKDTILWFLVAGFPLLFTFDRAGKDERFFQSAVRSTIALSVFVGFFINITSFNLWVELTLQIVLVLLGGMSVVAGRDKQYALAKRVCDTLLGLIGINLAAFTAAEIYQQRHQLDLDQLWRTLAMSIWLPLVALPFVYLFALFASYDSAFSRMGVADTRQRLTWKARLALFVGLNGHVREVHAFKGRWIGQVKSAPTFPAALESVRSFRAHQDQRRAEEQERQDRLRRYAGVDGTDTEGKRLDQREFTETKEALRWLATCQMGWYRNHGSRYRPELLETLGDFSSKGLPKEHGIVMEVRSDGQAWYAWRRTAGGWVFAIGAEAQPPDQWLYDGIDAPAGFPGTAKGWDHFAPAAAAINW